MQYSMHFTQRTQRWLTQRTQSRPLRHGGHRESAGCLFNLPTSNLQLPFSNLQLPTSYQAHQSTVLFQLPTSNFLSTPPPLTTYHSPPTTHSPGNPIFLTNSTNLLSSLSGINNGSALIRYKSVTSFAYTCSSTRKARSRSPR